MEKKIPKIIHYCWFGGKEYPDREKKCIQTWRKVLTDYEFKLWNEENFDINCNLWVKEAYALKKYAFVSDFVRLYVLNTYGGIYLDTDVKMVKPFDDLLDLDGFLCFEDLAGNVIASCVIGMKKAHPLLNELLMYYDQAFDAEDIVNNFKSNTLMFTEKLQRHGLKLCGKRQRVFDIEIFPRTYFCPMDYFSNWNKTEDSYCIHLFSGSWLPKDEYQKLAGRRKLWWRVGKLIFIKLKQIEIVQALRDYIKEKKVIKY